MIALSILAGSIIIALSIIAASGVVLAALAKFMEDFEGRFHMFFALASMQVTMQLEDRGKEVPEWLKAFFEDDEEEKDGDKASSRKLTLVKLRKDYPEEL